VTTLSVMTGFTFLSRLTQIAPPYTWFVYLGAGIRLGLPSHPASRRRSCLRLGVSTTSSSRGLPPPSDRPCRAYSRRRLRCRWPGVSARAQPLPRPARRTPGHPHRAHRSRWANRHADRCHAQPSSSPFIVPLPAAASRSLPAVASHAIGFAEPRPDGHSPGFGAYRG
jgi:hypothetical protein